MKKECTCNTWSYVRCKKCKEDASHLVKQKRIFKTIQAWINKNEISCPETIYQVDKVQHELYALVEKLCGIVGYYEYSNEK